MIPYEKININKSDVLNKNCSSLMVFHANVNNKAYKRNDRQNHLRKKRLSGNQKGLHSKSGRKIKTNWSTKSRMKNLPKHVQQILNYFPGRHDNIKSACIHAR